MINFAIVGMGHISKKHIEAISNIKEANLVAVCDANEERLAEYEGTYKAYSDLELMLTEEPTIDVVNICVPSGLHARLTKIVASFKKHVIVEKPMALTVADAEEMIKVTNENKVKLAVVHPNRFRPAIQALREKVKNEAFGTLSHANATVRWNRNQAYYDQADWRGSKEFDGGVLMNQAIHNLDLLIWMMGPVKSVQAMAKTRLRAIEAEDLASAVIEFENGALGIIEAATTIYPKNLEESLAVFGERGSAIISGVTANHIETWNFENGSDEETEQLKETIKSDPFGKPGHQWIIEDMVDAVKEGRDPIVTGEDGLAPVRLITKILESAEKGQRLDMFEVKEGVR
ncbi:Gfo/Idh/MocA family protein [Alkalihalobacillus deserti]|uniref:Gfo/Idh/MocA family protein n=1 Tax=Alkalihalobacillus deserti TaxID=2879466 RepID=UPI001D139EAF|nr:Gfo/Idh/MocA family oxidoreductase [Alkalihalobacillus deserti]